MAQNRIVLAYFRRLMRVNRPENDRLDEIRADAINLRSLMLRPGGGGECGLGEGGQGRGRGWGDVVGWGTKEKGKKGFAPLFKVHQLVSLRCLSHYFEPSSLSVSTPLSLHPLSLTLSLRLFPAFIHSHLHGQNACGVLFLFLHIYLYRNGPSSFIFIASVLLSLQKLCL